MAKVYAIDSEWGSVEMERIHVQNEDLELQRILEKITPCSRATK